MLDDIKKTPWATAGRLRADMEAAGYKNLDLGLEFPKFVIDAIAALPAGPRCTSTDLQAAHFQVA
jgi:hypothetical protein